jgi:hypothetical protein
MCLILMNKMVKMMMIKKLIIILLVSSISGIVLSQENDFGLWFQIDGEHVFTKKLDGQLSLALRTFDNSSRIDEVFAEGGLQYSFNKYFSAAASYRLTNKSEENFEYYLRHKVFLSVRSSVPVGNFIFSGRLMMQRTTKSYIEEEEDLSPKYTLRFKVRSYYNIPAFPLNPYLYCEFFAPFSSGSGLSIGKNRLSGGADFKINSRNSLQLEYIFQRDYQPHLSDENIISLSYKIKF